jgi:hypothetical protein
MGLSHITDADIMKKVTDVLSVQKKQFLFKYQMIKKKYLKKPKRKV